MRVVQKYLARYAEPEASLALSISDGYAAALIVPALAEPIELLDGYRVAARAVSGRVLLILVVNAGAGLRAELEEENARLLAKLAELDAQSESLSPAVRRIRTPDFDLLSIDRSSPGRELPAKCGVGLARKIGMDFALALYAQGKLRSPWLFSTDADASLPAAYFQSTAQARSCSSALLYPFRHTGSFDRTTAATELYEMALRYQVLGLSWAGSPYAYHSIGSALAVRAEAYAHVRGVPKREAGEDFYLLDKLGKIAPLQRLGGEPVQIRARRSTRVPFGTGPRVSAILAENKIWVPEPRAFFVLAELLAALLRFASSRDERDLSLTEGLTPGTEFQSAERALAELGIREACREAARAVRTGNLGRRLLTWFDALRTLRFLHALRAAGLRDLPLEAALERAPFTPGVASVQRDQALFRLRQLESQLPDLIGPAWDGPGS